MAQITGRRDVSIGRQIEDIAVFASMRQDDPSRPLPWRMALENAVGVERIRMVIGEGSGARILLVSCAPLGPELDNPVERRLRRRKGAEGCLVVLADQTLAGRARAALACAQGPAGRARADPSEERGCSAWPPAIPMTGCLNRRAFFEQAGALKERCNLEGRPVAAVMCDIDHFKSFNDRYGHAIGDEVIKAVAGIYNGSAREADLVCRYGGEEFCVLLPDCEEAVALAIADTLRRLVQDTAGDGIDHDPRLTITSSFGVAVTRSTRGLGWRR